MNKEQRKKKFHPQWLEIDQFKSWLREIPHDANSCSCITCNKTITAGLSDIYRHTESKIHKKNSGNSDIVSKSIEDLNTQINEPLLTFDERKKAAEIKYAAFIAEKNISHQTATEILKLFQQIGQDPNVLKKNEYKSYEMQKYNIKRTVSGGNGTCS